MRFMAFFKKFGDALKCLGTQFGIHWSKVVFGVDQQTSMLLKVCSREVDLLDHKDIVTNRTLIAKYSLTSSGLKIL